ncbi:MAG: CHAT domain-containing protein, partial [Cyanobacteria bacterium P01_F01_bin.153]
ETALTGNPNDTNSAEGREISSLVYYFTAGSRAKAVLATLWKVDDGYTRVFMEEFYKNLANNPDLTKAEVLRKTQLAFINNEVTAPENAQSKANHPYNWAPFTLTGNSW